MPARLPATQEEYATRMEAAVAGRVGAGRYELWFRQHVRFVAGPDGLMVSVTSLHFREWLPQSFGREIEAAAAEVFGRPTPVRFEVEEPVENLSELEKPVNPAVNLFGERLDTLGCFALSGGLTEASGQSDDLLVGPELGQEPQQLVHDGPFLGLDLVE